MIAIAPAVRSRRLRSSSLALALAGGGFAAPAVEAQTTEAPSAPVEVSSRYTVDVLSNLRGGARRGTRLMGLLELDATLNGQGIGADDLSLTVNVQAAHGGGFTDAVVGDVHGISNIDAPPGIRPLEAYAALKFGSNRQGVVKVGLIDLNADFDVQEVGGLFINSSFGIGPDFSQSGLNGPSIFPTTASAVTLEWAQGPVTTRVGLFDGVAGDPDRPRRIVVRFPGDTGLLVVGEVEVALGDSAKVQFGGWGYDRRFDAIDSVDASGNPHQTDDNRGFYGLIEGTLARDGGNTLNAWLRLGAANGRINPINVYAGGGMSFGDDRRRTGVAFAYARLGDPSVRAGQDAGSEPERGEMVIEMTHSRQLLERLRVQPNAQYVINPGWNRNLGNALVLGVRLELELF